MTLIQDAFSGKRDWHRSKKQDKWNDEKRNIVLVFKGAVSSFTHMLLRIIT